MTGRRKGARNSQYRLSEYDKSLLGRLRMVLAPDLGGDIPESAVIRLAIRKLAEAKNIVDSKGVIA